MTDSRRPGTAARQDQVLSGWFALSSAPAGRAAAIRTPISGSESPRTGAIISALNPIRFSQAPVSDAASLQDPCRAAFHPSAGAEATGGTPRPPRASTPPPNPRPSGS